MKVGKKSNILEFTKGKKIRVVLPEPGKEVKIVNATLGDDAPIYGGLALAEDFLG